MPGVKRASDTGHKGLVPVCSFPRKTSIHLGAGGATGDQATSDNERNAVCLDLKERMR